MVLTHLSKPAAGWMQAQLLARTSGQQLVYISWVSWKQEGAGLSSRAMYA